MSCRQIRAGISSTKKGVLSDLRGKDEPSRNEAYGCLDKSYGGGGVDDAALRSRFRPGGPETAKPGN